MTALSPPLATLLASLLAASERSREIELDALGDAAGALALSADDVDRLLGALEAAGRRVVTPRESPPADALRSVLAAARALRAELGRPPRVDELITQSGLSEGTVRRALLFARVLSR